MLIVMEFFKTQSDPKRTKLHNIFKIFSGELAYALNSPAYACNYN